MRGRVLLLSVGVLGAAWLLSGCLPTADGLDLLVTVFTDAPDALVGDGVCEATAGMGDCTLRAAVQEANASPGGDKITAPAGTYTLTVAGAGENAAATGDLDIEGPILVVGSGAVIDGGGLDRVLDVRSGTLILDDVTVEGGSDATAGGVALSGGNLQAFSTTVSGNSSSAGVGGVGGSAGSATLKWSTVSGNTGVTAGGVSVAGSLTLENVTVSGNTATDGTGGGVEVAGGSATLTHVTVTDNTGGGVEGSAGPASALSSIVGMQSSGFDCTGVIPTSLGYNIDSDGSCGLTGTGDLSNTDPLLGPLQDNGGPTATHAPLFGSPVIDSADPACASGGGPTDDQRGIARPQGSDCDRGAVEVQDGEAVGVDCDPANFVPFANLAGAQLQNCDMAGVDLSDADLTGADARGADLTDADFSYVDISGADFGGATLLRTRTDSLDMTGTDFTDADLTKAWADDSSWIGTATWSNTICPNELSSEDDWNTPSDPTHDVRPTPIGCAYRWVGPECVTLTFAPASQLLNCNLVGADLTGVDLSGARLTATLLDGAVLDGATLDSALLPGARMVGASMVAADVTDALFSDIDFTGADLTRVFHQPLSAPSSHDNIWTGATCANGFGPTERNAFGGCDYSYTTPDCVTANLVSGALLLNCNLVGADLSGLDLTEAYLAGAMLDGADLTGSNLTGVELGWSWLPGASIAGADLDLASFSDPGVPGITGPVLNAATGIPLNAATATWAATTTCPDGTAAGDNGSPATCAGHFLP